MTEFQLIGFVCIVIALTLIFIVDIFPKKKITNIKDTAEEQEESGNKQLDIEDAKVFFLNKEEVKKEHPWQRELDAAMAADLFKVYVRNNKLRYCGPLAVGKGVLPLGLNTILKELEAQPDLEVSDFYNYLRHKLAIWTGEKWLLGDISDIIEYNPHSRLETRVSVQLVDTVKFSPELLEYKERLDSSINYSEFNKILAEGETFFITTRAEDEWPFNRWKRLNDQVVARKEATDREYRENLIKASNKQVYDIALSVSDEPIDNIFVDIIRREFSARLAILKELDLARQYQMDQQEQAKQELDEAAKFF